MARVYAEIDDRLADFISAQHMFFVASAPLSAGGSINLSPKGSDALRILDPHTVAYLDLTGSGVETIAHVRENRRIVLMFCAFEGPPKILRLHGRAEVVERGDSEFASLRTLFPPLDGDRAVVRVAVQRIADSCGYNVPLYRFDGDRSQLRDWTERKGATGLRQYRTEHNSSIDGLPGLRCPDA